MTHQWKRNNRWEVTEVEEIFVEEAEQDFNGDEMTGQIRVHHVRRTLDQIMWVNHHQIIRLTLWFSQITINGIIIMVKDGMNPTVNRILQKGLFKYSNLFSHEFCPNIWYKYIFFGKILNIKVKCTVAHMDLMLVQCQEEFQKWLFISQSKWLFLRVANPLVEATKIKWF